jgi:hypothetical protein
MPAQAFQRKTLEKVNHLKEKGLGDATQSEIDMIPRTLMETMMSETNSLETRRDIRGETQRRCGKWKDLVPPLGN